MNTLLSNLSGKVYLLFFGGICFFLMFGSLTRPNLSAAESEPGEQSEELEFRELKGNHFITTDGVMLSGSYYPGGKSEETVPVVLLHGQKKNHQEFKPLIEELKKHNYAIITLDFRGHGESTKRIPAIKKEQPRVQPVQQPQHRRSDFNPAFGGNNGGFSGPFGRRHNQQHPQPEVPPQTVIEPGTPIDYLHEDFKADDYKRLFNYDCVPFQKFLVVMNNEKQLNLHKLVIIGCDMGGSVGAQWARQSPKYVKSLIVLDPNHDSASKRFFKNAKIFQKEVPVLFVVGRRNEEAKLNAIELRNELLGKEKSKDDDPYSLSSVAPILELPTDRRGSDVFSDSKLNAAKQIIHFIEMKLESVKEKDLKWRRI